MLLTLSEDDSLMLRDLLRDYLPGLKFEIARTDRRQLRHVLLEREELCERLLVELGRLVEKSAA